MFQLLVSECCGNGTSISRGEKNQKIHLPPLRQRFLDHTGTFYYDLRKEEHIIIDLALKMAMKGMSEEAIARCIGNRASYRTFKAAFMFKPHIIKLQAFSQLPLSQLSI